MEKINIAELLKDCPKGMELDCTNYNGVVSLKGITNDDVYPIEIQVVCGNECNTHTLTKYGQTVKTSYNKCIIFPKGKTTWEGFVPPCQFKDGDIIFTHANCLKVGVGNTWISIFKERRNGGVATYVDYAEDGSDYYSDLDGDKALLCMESDILRQRFATEEEKEKLFQVIRDNGYCWNSETKTLEKVFPYNIGTKVWVKSDKEHEHIHTIVGISHNCLGNLEYEVKEEKTGIIVHYPKELLIPITTKEPKFKAGDKVRRKNNHNLVFTITSIEEDSYGCGANLVLWFDDQDDYELVPNKFDITTLKPFDKVLVRDHDRARWNIQFYQLYDSTNKSYPYCTLGAVYKQCIPYKGNEDLIGLVKDCDYYYKSWINEENEFN